MLPGCHQLVLPTRHLLLKGNYSISLLPPKKKHQSKGTGLVHASSTSSRAVQQVPGWCTRGPSSELLTREAVMASSESPLGEHVPCPLPQKGPPVPSPSGEPPFRRGKGRQAQIAFPPPANEGPSAILPEQTAGSQECHRPAASGPKLTWKESHPSPEAACSKRTGQGDKQEALFQPATVPSTSPPGPSPDSLTATWSAEWDL